MTPITSRSCPTHRNSTAGQPGTAEKSGIGNSHSQPPASGFSRPPLNSLLAWLLEQFREFQPAWIMAQRHAFEYFGGVFGGRIIVNFKAGVDKPDREELRLNPKLRDVAQHHGVAVLRAGDR